MPKLAELAATAVGWRGCPATGVGEVMLPSPCFDTDVLCHAQVRWQQCWGFLFPAASGHPWGNCSCSQAQPSWPSTGWDADTRAQSGCCAAGSAWAFLRPSGSLRSSKDCVFEICV